MSGVQTACPISQQFWQNYNTRPLWAEGVMDPKSFVAAAKAIVALGVTTVIALWSFAYLIGATGPIGQIHADLKEHRQIEPLVIKEIRKVCRNTARTEAARVGCDED